MSNDRGLAGFYDFRGRLLNALATDLIGPTASDETLDDAPLERYISGILYPQSAEPVSPTEDVDIGEEDDESGFSDPPVALANVRYPSSAGLSFAADSSLTKELLVEVAAGQYEQIQSQPGLETGTPRRRRQALQSRWRRKAIGPFLVPLPIDKNETGRWVDLKEGLQLYYRVRVTAATSVRAATVVLVNTRNVVKGMKDADAFFQPVIRVVDRAGKAVFVQRPTQQALSSDKDLASYRLLYRHAQSFAVGHGCSATWEAEASADRATAITASFAPEFDLRLSDSNQSIKSQALGMSYLVEHDRSEVVRELRVFAAGYEAWLSARRKEIPSLPEDIRSVATEHIEFCGEALRRIAGGIELLSTADRAWRAFRLANRAMLRVRARSEWLRSGRPAGGPSEGPQHRWRPFQLAFILLCLGGIVDDGSEDRDFADLLWFPTGGGKTEAYLGLIAFTVFLRRMRDGGPSGAGVTVLMRYTMRLLTIQQFERAASLMCTAEIMRREESLGDVPISIGLWIGQGATPNSLKDARNSLDKLRNNAVLTEKNPVQLHACPWCGQALDHTNYWLGRNPDRLVIGCRQDDCAFKDGLPVWVVDEDIYRERPTLVIATADKFASLPWSEDVGEIFNIGPEPSRPPELIIQDELHLISGPLGTLAGLYETAIDLLCTSEGVRPKVVASTATIRRAGQQSEALFDRKIRQFPPPGLDARDSYFAVETDPTVRGSRLYVGLMAPGASQTTLLVRSYASLLQSVNVLQGADSTKDPYWTLVGYFNSLRVLGGARMQVQDDVKDRIDFLADVSGEKPRPIEERIELTSREPSGNIPGHLKHMAVERPSDNALDVILATNMISVGVDVDRLGLMVVMGQPQSASEYIQATSRVGRKLPGLVVVLFNAARSRDRSHYEAFVAYHSGLYRQVESTSVTPYSPRARDRALHAVVVSLARLLVPGLRMNGTAKNLASVESAVRQLNKKILERVARISPRDLKATEEELNRVLVDWTSKVGNHPDLAFRDLSHPERALLVDIGQESASDGAFPTLRSLRDVDAASNLYLVR